MPGVLYDALSTRQADKLYELGPQGAHDAIPEAPAAIALRPQAVVAVLLL